MAQVVASVVHPLHVHAYTRLCVSAGWTADLDHRTRFMGAAPPPSTPIPPVPCWRRHGRLTVGGLRFVGWHAAGGRPSLDDGEAQCPGVTIGFAFPGHACARGIGGGGGGYVESASGIQAREGLTCEA